MRQKMQTFISSDKYRARGLEMFISDNLRSDRESGVTLVELLVVIVIIAIVAALALMQKGSADSQFKRQNVAQELKVAFERARFDSVKRRAQPAASPSPDTRAKVVVDTTSYALTTYPINSSGTPTLTAQTTTVSGQNITIAGNSVALPYTVYYNQRGEAVDSGGFSISPSFLVCNFTCASPTNANANLLIVTPTGTINLLPGGSTAPNFNAPTITNVSPTSGINNTARLP
jgi:prepilin-type N-terminal cleavage/methylation domain-containing protein